MSRYLLLYRGPARPMSEFTPEESAESGAAWGEWIGRVGAALVDVGTPFGERAALADDGSSGTPSDQNGYSIVEAGSLDDARALLKDHPFLSEGKGRFSVEVFELVPMEM